MRGTVIFGEDDGVCVKMFGKMIEIVRAGALKLVNSLVVVAYGHDVWAIDGVSDEFDDFEL